MPIHVEYYEVPTANGYKYYYMPVDGDALNKENFDTRSHRIWKLNTRTNQITEVRNIRENQPGIDQAEFFKIQLMAEPVPWSENYLYLQKVKEYHAELKAEKSSSVD